MMIELIAILPILGFITKTAVKSAVAGFTAYGIKRKMTQEMQIVCAYMRERSLTSEDIESEIRNRMNMIMRR